MKTKTINTYSFAELSDDAKQYAYQQSLKGEFYPAWTEENHDSLKAFCDLFPCDIDRRGNYRFTGSDNQENLKSVRLATYLYNNYLKGLYKGKYLCVTNGHFGAVGMNTKSRHSNVQFEINCPFTGYCMDMELLDELIKFVNKPDSRDMEMVLRDCVSNWEHAVERDMEWQQSFEYFADECEANEREFDENGKAI